jgi:hypothetical protein
LAGVAAQAAPAAINWTKTYAGASVGIQPASDGLKTSVANYNYYTATNAGNTTLYKVDQMGNVACSTAATELTGEVAQSAPVPVKLHDTNTYIFLTTDHANVYRFPVAGCGVGTWTHDKSHSFKRMSGGVAVCAVGSGDILTASPTIALQDITNGPSQDLVIVPTRYGCTSTDNRVIALDAATLGSIIWQSNKTTAPADYFADGCTIDYDNHLVYCGAHDNGGAFQNTLFAFDYKLSGTIAAFFQNKPGSLVNHAVLRNKKLIVATLEGSVVAYDISAPVSGTNPTESWRLNISGVSFQTAPWAEFRDGFQHVILLRSQDGALRRVDENLAGTGASVVGGALLPAAPGGATFIGNPAIFADQGKLYVGTDNGYIAQVDFTSTGFSSASLEAYANTNTSSTVIYDPVLDFTPGATPTVDRLIAAAVSATQTQVREWHIPWQVGTSNSTSGSGWGNGVSCTTIGDCYKALPNPDDQPCVNVGCNATPNSCTVGTDCASGVCSGGFCSTRECMTHWLPANNGASCAITTDCNGNPNTGVCSDGHCRMTDYSVCPCVNNLSPSCGTGQSCCNGTCLPLTDIHNCGGCGIDCDPISFMHQKQLSGLYSCVTTGGTAHCERNAAACKPPVPGDIIKQHPELQTPGLSQVTFNYMPVSKTAPASCDAYVASTAQASSYYEITSTGNTIAPFVPKTSWNSLPVFGVSVASADQNIIAATPVTLGGAIQISPGLCRSLTANCGGYMIDHQAPATNFSGLYQAPKGNIVAGTAFFDSNWNSAGPAGPAINPVFLNRKIGRFYVGNIPNDGDVSYFDATWNGTAWVFPTVDQFTIIKSYGTSKHVNALTVALRRSNAVEIVAVNGNHPAIDATLAYALDGENIVHLLCDPTITNAGQKCFLPLRDLNLSRTGTDYLDWVDPDNGKQLQPISNIQSLASDPVSGAIIVGGRSTNPLTGGNDMQMIYIDPTGLGARNYGNWPWATSALPGLSLGAVDMRPALSPVGTWHFQLGAYGKGVWQVSTFGVTR